MLDRFILRKTADMNLKSIDFPLTSKSGDGGEGKLPEMIRARNFKRN